jgi:hypothetical protein
MQTVMKNEKGNTICKENLLAALQKLSVRYIFIAKFNFLIIKMLILLSCNFGISFHASRNIVSVMINENLTEWIVDLLEDNEELTDYTLEYAIALLMNLCLRIEGKRRCAKMYEKTLKILTELLGNTNSEVEKKSYSFILLHSIKNNFLR